MTLIDRTLGRTPRAALLAAGLALAVYAPALGNGFAYDDVPVIAQDPALHTLTSLPSRLLDPYWPSSFGAQVGSWRPLTTGLFGLTWVASGGSPLAFHAVGIGLHALATALVVLVLAELIAPLGAAVAGIAFAVHPVHVEAVANVVGTAEPFAAVFVLLALLLHVRSGAEYGWGRVAAVAGLYLAAVLAKEGAAVLPALLLLVDAARTEIDVSGVTDYLRRRGKLFLVLTACLALLLWARASVLGAALDTSTPPGMAVLHEMPRIWTIAITWTHYFRLLLMPLDLASDYGPGVIPVAFGWTPAGLLGVVLVLVSLAGAALSWRLCSPLGRGGASPRALGLGVLWAAVAILPVANILYLSPVILAERTLYLASVGATLGMGWMFLALREQSARGAWIAAALIVLGGGVRSGMRERVWHDSGSVAATLLEQHPESGRGWWYFGQELDARGRPAQALRAFSVAMGLLDSEYQVAVDVASRLMARDRAGSARFLLERAWREHPEWYSAPGLLAALELGEGRPGAALEAARGAALLEPTNPSMHHLLAQSLSALGRPAEAVEARRAALAAGFSDRWRSWMLLGIDLGETGRVTEALAALDSADVRAETAEDTLHIAAARAVLESAVHSGIDPHHNEGE